MERLAVDRGVRHQARVARDRLPARLADVGLVVPARDPSAVAVELDALADDGADGRVLGRAHEGGQPIRQDHVVRVEERQPRPARDVEPAVPRVRDPAVGRQPDQDHPRVTLGDRGHDVGGAVGGGVVDDEHLQADVDLVEDRGQRPFDRRRGVPGGQEDREPGRCRIGHACRAVNGASRRAPSPRRRRTRSGGRGRDTGRAPRPGAPGPHP